MKETALECDMSLLCVTKKAITMQLLVDTIFQNREYAHQLRVWHGIVVGLVVCTDCQKQNTILVVVNWCDEGAGAAHHPL